MGNGIKLAEWILSQVGKPITHLKLQKLAFYCYGAVLANDREHELGEVRFEAWAHGPVCREIWNTYRNFADADLPSPAQTPTYPADVCAHLADALAVYGKLDAWNLRQQSHLEEPWCSAWNNQTRIDPSVLKAHFRRKFNGTVKWPEYLSRGSSLALDGIPQETFVSLHDLADAARKS